MPGTPCVYPLDARKEFVNTRERPGVEATQTAQDSDRAPPSHSTAQMSDITAPWLSLIVPVSHSNTAPTMLAAWKPVGARRIHSRASPMAIG